MPFKDTVPAKALYADAEDGAIDPQRSAALDDKVAGLNAAIYVLEQVQGWADSCGISIGKNQSIFRVRSERVLDISGSACQP
jgi:hypothetical protein